MNTRFLVKALAVAALLACAGLAQADTIIAADPRVVRMGRTVAEPDGTLRFGYPGVTLDVAFNGTRLSMDAAGGGSNSLLDVIVDGGAPMTLRLAPGQRSVDLVKDAAPGPHRVRLVHRTETWLGIVSVARFTSDGAFTAASSLPARRMLVLGDSVTCGADMERGEAGKPVDKNDPAWWNARLSYGMLAARELGAQVHLVCFGGRGLVRSWNGRTDEGNLADFYELAIPDGARPARWRHADYDPDLVLVAIGTNDFTQGIPERASYVAAYEGFVRTLLRNHPRARIALTEGAILDGEKKAALTEYIAETVRRVGSPRVAALPSLHHPGDAIDMHPTTPQHAEMARELAPRLRQFMGW